MLLRTKLFPPHHHHHHHHDQHHQFCINIITNITPAIIIPNMGAYEKDEITKFSRNHDIELFGEEEMMTRKRFLTRGRKGQAVEAMGVKCLSICLGAQFTTRSG